MDAHVTIPKPDNLTLAQVSTAGVALLTACLGVFDALSISLVDPSALPGPRNEWVLVFGGAGSVGQFAVQLFKVCGFKVVATCSQKSFDVSDFLNSRFMLMHKYRLTLPQLVKSLGADELIEYKLSDKDIIEKIKSVTGGQLNYAYDCVSVRNLECHGYLRLTHDN